MGKLPDEEVTEDILEVLTEFWLATMRMNDVDMPDRMKASEMLARYVLDLGRTKIKTGGPRRPSTAEVLKIAAQLEGKRG